MFRIIVLLLLSSVACGQEFKVSPRYNISERVQSIDNDYFIVFVTSNCQPCERIKNETIPKVKAAGYRIRTINISDQPQWGYTNAPHVWRCKNQIKLQSWTGFVTAETLIASINLKVEAKQSKQRMSFNELIREHNRLHGGDPNRRWTWPGGTEESLRQHLRNVHGVNTG